MPSITILKQVSTKLYRAVTNMLTTNDILSRSRATVTFPSSI
ncbi:hypothetical protein [Fretibacterium fastidiosum]|nr:hypothetical protein [Fretibacterium fastidiosum]